MLVQRIKIHIKPIKNDLQQNEWNKEILLETVLGDAYIYTSELKEFLLKHSIILCKQNTLLS